MGAFCQECVLDLCQVCVCVWRSMRGACVKSVCVCVCVVSGVRLYALFPGLCDTKLSPRRGGAAHARSMFYTCASRVAFHAARLTSNPSPAPGDVFSAGVLIVFASVQFGC